MSRILAVVVLLFLLPAPQAVAATQQVHMSGYAYGPATLTIKVGDTVTWTNHDQAPHDAVTTAGPAQFRSPMLATGQTWSFTFTTPGTYSYYCSVHPDMRGQIVVQPAPAAQAPPPPQAPKQQQQQQTPRRQTTTSSAAAAAPPPPAAATPAAEPPAEEEVVQQQTVAAAAPPAQRAGLDPLLLVAGLVAGVATLCLLLIGSRSSAS
jgi:amicyanin